MSKHSLIGIMFVSFVSGGMVFAQEHSGQPESGLYVSAGAGIALVPEYISFKYLKDGKTVTSEHEDVYQYYWTYDLGWSGRGAVGFYLGDGARAEAEVSVLIAGLQDVHGRQKKDFTDAPMFTAISVMANGLYELDTGSPLRPFVGLGVGPALTTYSFGKLKAASERQQQEYDQGVKEAAGWSAAYQATAGLSYEIFDGFAVRLAYRFFEMPFRQLTYERKLDKEDSEYATYDTVIGSYSVPATTAHRIEVGMTYRLPPF